MTNSYAQETSPKPQKNEFEQEFPKKWDRTFPLMAQKLLDRGFKFQLPYGISSQYFYADQDLQIPEINVSLNEAKTYDVSNLVEIGQVRTKGGVFTVRPNFWLLPFMNLYAIVGVGKTETTIPFNAITLPDRRIEIGKSSVIENEGYTYGGGVSFAGRGLGMIFIIDINASFTKMKRFKEPFPVAVTSFRLGKNFKLRDGREVAAWIGGMGQYLTAKTVGKIFVKDFAPNIENEAAELEMARDDNCNQIGSIWVPKMSSSYTAAQCNAVAIMANIANGAAGSSINYELDKELVAIWNFVLGFNFQVTRNWYARAELGIINRQQILIGAEYRF